MREKAHDEFSENVHHSSDRNAETRLEKVFFES